MSNNPAYTKLAADYKFLQPTNLQAGGGLSVTHSWAGVPSSSVPIVLINVATGSIVPASCSFASVSMTSSYMTGSKIVATVISGMESISCKGDELDVYNQQGITTAWFSGDTSG